MTNKYLEKIAESRKYDQFVKSVKGKQVTDKQLALSGTSVRLASKFVPNPIGYASRAVYHKTMGRDVSGALREEGRGLVTGATKSIGYAGAGLAAGAGVGAIVGKLVGNKRMARFGANAIGHTANFVKGTASKMGIPHGHLPGGKRLLDDLAGNFPEQTRKILSHKHLGAMVGAATAGAGSTLVGSAVGSQKGQYDGRLASIRNQIREGRLGGVKLTEDKSKK